MTTIPAVLALLLQGPVSAFAQSTAVCANPLTDHDIRLLRDYFQSIGDQVAKNAMQFTAAELTERFFQVEDNAQTLRKAYFSMFKQALGRKRAATFYQVDNHLAATVNWRPRFPLVP